MEGLVGMSHFWTKRTAVVLFMLGAFSFDAALTGTRADNFIVEQVEPPSDVIVLTDDSFEAETQASTGMTTGPWFVKFYIPRCEHCEAMAQAWRDLSSEVKGTVNVAQVDGNKTLYLTKRFQISGYPALLFFHNNKMYTYKGDRTVEAMKTFCLGGYERVEGEAVPQDWTVVDHMLDNGSKMITQMMTIFRRTPLGFVTLLICGAFIGVLMSAVMGWLLGTGEKLSTSRRTKVLSKKKD